MFGILGGPWKLAGSPLGREGCALLACCTPGGGAVPGADMPGGGPVALLELLVKKKMQTYPFPAGVPYQEVYQSGRGRLQIQGGGHKALLFTLSVSIERWAGRYLQLCSPP